MLFPLSLSLSEVCMSFSFLFIFLFPDIILLICVCINCNCFFLCFSLFAFMFCSFYYFHSSCNFCNSINILFFLSFSLPLLILRRTCFTFLSTSNCLGHICGISFFLVSYSNCFLDPFSFITPPVPNHCSGD